MSLKKTEDGFVVHTLYTDNFPNNFSEELLQEYFSEFGEVCCVNIQLKDEKATKYAFINFKDAESATAALKTNHHYVRGQHLFVKEADSWWQLKSRSNIKIKSNSLMMKLNYDCFLHIFSFLSTREKVKLAQANDRFKQVFEYTDIKNKTVFFSNLTLMEIRFICREFGRIIQTINIGNLNISQRSKNLYRAPKYIAKYCRELRCLCFEDMRNSEFTKFGLMKNLTKISLRNCDITDDVCFYLSKLQNLKYLDVSENSRLTGKYLKDFPQLAHLNLHGCIGIKLFTFLPFCSHSKIIRNLKSLNLAECFYSKSYIFAKLASLENLENLAISTNDLSLLQDIQGLKQLIIYTADSLFHPCKELTEKDIPSLETLLIIGETDAFPFQPSKILKSLIFSMKNIKRLGLIHCSNLDDEDMNKIATMPELTYLNITGCHNISLTALLNLLKKPNKLQHIDISESGFFDNFLPSWYAHAAGVILKKMKETGRTTPCTLYDATGIKCTDTIESEDSRSLLRLVGKRSAFPGLKHRKFHKYEFED